MELLLSPVGELVPLFVDDLRRLAQHRQVVLPFDNFERACDLVDGDATWGDDDFRIAPPVFGE